MPSPARVLITFCVGVAATLAWQSYGDAARQSVANSYPQLGWLAPRHAATAQAASSPDQRRLSAISLDLDAVRQNVDRIATTQEQITRSVDRLKAGQERMTREITELQAIEEQILHKNSEPPLRQAPAQVPKPATQSVR